MKKIISVCLCALLILSVFCLGISAESKKSGGTAQISVANATGNPGEEVFINISIADNSKITDYVLTLNFDKSVLDYKGYFEGDLNDYTLYEHADEGRVTLVSLGGESEPKNGNIIAFKFSINKKAKAGESELTLLKTSFMDKDGNSQTADLKNGEVKISNPCAEKHDYSKWGSQVKATCTKDGVNVRICLNCGSTESKTVTAKGHKLASKFTVDVAAEGSKPGMLSRHCEECGAKTNIIVYTNNNTAGLGINNMLGKLSDDSVKNLVYFINGNTSYPDITDENFDINSFLLNNTAVKNENGTFNLSSIINRVLQKLFGSDKKSGIIGALKRAALADEIPIKFLGKLISLIF